jgi:hypothetical protein
MADRSSGFAWIAVSAADGGWVPGWKLVRLEAGCSAGQLGGVRASDGGSGGGAGDAPSRTVDSAVAGCENDDPASLP